MEELKLKIGEMIGGKVVEEKLSDLKNLLVVGHVGAGKTVFLQSIIEKLQENNIKIIVFDPKGVEYENNKNVKVITETQDVEKTLKAFHDTIKKGEKDDNLTFFIVDESADYFLWDKKINRIMCEVFEKGYESGIFPIYSILNFKYLPNKVVKNINSMVAFDYENNILLQDMVQSELERFESIFYQKGTLITQLKPAPFMKN